MNTIITHKWVFLILSILASLPFLSQLPKVKTVDNVDYFTLENDPDVLFYDGFKEIFGNDEFFIIAFKKENIFTRENLEVLQQITGDLEEIEEIREVKSLANTNDTIGEEDFFMVQKFLEHIPDREKDLNRLKQSALSNPLYARNFISPDGKTAAVVVSVYEKPDDPGYRKRLLEKCDAVLSKYRNQTGEVFKAGWTTTNYYLSRYMKQDIATFIPITYVFITLAVFFFFRNVWLTLIAVLNISICMGSTMGLFPILGITLNNVTTIVPPVVMALALCDTVHIFSHLDRELLDRYENKGAALGHVLTNVIKPCFLTTLTTAIGFISLYLSDIPPIKDFAVIASCGMIFEFFFSFVFMPPVLMLFNTDRIFQEKTTTIKIHATLEKTASFVLNRFRLILTAGVVLTLVSILLASSIKVETNLLGYFKKKSPVRVSSDFVETHLAGISTLDISLTALAQDEFKDPENLKIIEKIQTFLEQVDGVDKSMSFVNFIKDMNQSFNNEQPSFLTIPDSKQLVSQYLLLYDADDIKDFINETFDHARISIRMSRHSTSEQEKIISQLNNFFKTLPKHDLKIRITGRALQDVNTIDSLVKGQVYSLSTAAAIIIVIMFFVLRSFPLGCISIVPNLFPIVLNFGIMGLFNIPLNTATALISAVAIGIAVDDTIHFLSEFKLNLSQKQSTQDAVTKTIKSKGKAILLSSLILCIGFGVMVFSRFVPTINFGSLSAVIMITAVAGDIFLLPSVALFWDKRGGRFV